MRHLFHNFQLIIPKPVCVLQYYLRIYKDSVHDYVKNKCVYRNKYSYLREAVVVLSIEEMVYMKKTSIIAGTVAIACVALCAAVWPRCAEVGNLPAEPVKAAVSAEIEVRSEETSHIFISADKFTPIAVVCRK